MKSKEASKKQATIYDVAKQTGLSTATISNIINQKGRYSPKTVERVQEAIRTLGYVPNLHARRLGSSIMNTVALVLSPELTSHQDMFQSQFISGLSAMAARNHYHVLLYSAPLPHEPLQTANDWFTLPVDGFVFRSRTTESEATFQYLLSSGKPFVYCGEPVSEDIYNHNIYGGFSLYFAEAQRLLYEKGCRNIVTLSRFNLYSQSTRYRTIKAALEQFAAEHGISCSLYLLPNQIDDDPMQLSILLDGLLAQKNPPDAFFFDSMTPTITAYNHFLEKGLHIPEDICILSVSHTSYSGLEFTPTLSTIYVNAYEMGQRSMELLLQQLKPEPRQEIDHYVPYQYIERDSTKKPPSLPVC